MAFIRRNEPERSVYRVQLVADEDEGRADDVRDRMGLLNAALTTALRGNKLLEMVDVDYVRGCLVFDMETTRLRGVRAGGVHVTVQLVAP